MACLANAVPIGGRILEIGTGCGVGLSWIVHGLGSRSDVEVVSVEIDSAIASSTRSVGWPDWVSIVEGDGADLVGTIGSQTGTCTRIYATSARCWGVNFVSQYGCRHDAFVKVNIYDSTGALVDTGIDQLATPAPGQVVTAHGDTFATSAASFVVTEIDCFDY